MRASTGTAHDPEVNVMKTSSIKTFLTKYSPSRTGGRSAPGAAADRPRSAARSCVEGLESRTLYSVGTAMVDGQLIVTGRNGTGNTITLDHVGDTTLVDGQSFADATITKGITVNSGTGKDTVRVLANARPMTINGNNGRDRVVLGRGASVQEIAADVTITNAASFTQVVLDNSADPQLRNVTVGIDENVFGFVTGLAPATVRFKSADTAGLVVAAGSGGHKFDVTNTVNNNAAPLTNLIGSLGADTFEIRGTSGKLEVQGSGGVDTFNVGNAANTLDDIKGTVKIAGGLGGPAEDRFNFNDQGSTTPHSYFQTATSVQRSGTPLVSFSSVEIQQFNFGPVATVGSAPMATDLKLNKTVAAGKAAKLTGRLVDPDVADRLAVSVDWGDGTGPQQKATNRKKFGLKHKYAQPGEYTVRVTWTDDNGLSNSQEFLITVTAGKAKK
jgi:hypothetical protein